jgi:hypothetical protein
LPIDNLLGFVARQQYKKAYWTGCFCGLRNDNNNSRGLKLKKIKGHFFTFRKNALLFNSETAG